ncbi:MAG TPA: NlpC/P60 family protein [Vitreimonas sp.]|uniref:NlpC/P60 family protein n=1 Tax=Vitreimonas sp. TaxID=3069702 RepID=UPI002D707749|nr:NlpC/P60 family protein [Vitreimonas sp.]HYD87107.1 NlpC/P60 family protein [Vitreimonas sp.]
MSVVFAPGAGVDLTPNAAAPLATWAPPLQLRGWFQDGGRGPLAFDCYGLAYWVQQLIGRRARGYEELYRELDIRLTREVDALFRAESDAWRNVAAGGVGDVLVLGSGGRAHHVGVLCGAGRMLHASAQAGLRIDPIEGRRGVTHAAGLKVFACVAPSR